MTYNVEPGDLNELATWKLMAESGEMSPDALRECSQLPFMEYEVNNLPDFEGLEEAKDLLISPKRRRLEAGVDVNLTTQRMSNEQKRRKNRRRIERLN